MKPGFGPKFHPENPQTNPRISPRSTSLPDRKRETLIDEFRYLQYTGLSRREARRQVWRPKMKTADISHKLR